LAPEVFRNEDYDTKVDVFSFALILQEMIEGCQPFISKNGKDVPELYAEKRRPPFNASSKNYAHGLKELIEECWHENPSKRPPFRQIIIRLESIYNSFEHKSRWKFQPLRCFGIRGAMRKGEDSDRILESLRITLRQLEKCIATTALTVVADALDQHLMSVTVIHDKSQPIILSWSKQCQLGFMVCPNQLASRGLSGEAGDGLIQWGSYVSRVKGNEEDRDLVWDKGRKLSFIKEYGMRFWALALWSFHFVCGVFSHVLVVIRSFGRLGT
ncbi:integrin-linked protein kinase 1-like protein isoform X1, partial [Tanacetum coccineum]